MILDRKPFIYVWRPFYRTVFDRLLWPLVRRLGQVATSSAQAELQTGFEQVRQDLERLRQAQERTSAAVLAVLDRQEQQERETAAQWTEIERLLLCVLRERRTDA